MSTANQFGDDPTLVLLTVEEAARRLSIGRTYCFRLLALGALDSVQLGRARRVPAEAVVDFGRKLRAEQCRGPVATTRKGVAA
ncbi:excisionase family DNA-binding protein [Streptomyces aureoverticillatus]|uniref:excisionase family DNA-binding protein n=1 Tax=Streptomyces aureoverticillatus TaxID=66871 RepID=UPI001EF84B96|nr:excisionase family DNA-binding protein [Streptomyces aureoverticillatus]